jgi:hypothetical protein
MMRNTFVVFSAVVTAAVCALPSCQSVPRGAGVYLVTVSDAKSGKPVEGIALRASGAGLHARGGKPSTATTDEDGEATLAFGPWGSVDLLLEADAADGASGASEERWLVMQDRVAVNGGKTTKEPLRMIVGSGVDGGVSRYKVSITRIERGPKIDN